MKQSELLFKFPYKMTSQVDWDYYLKKHSDNVEAGERKKLEVPEYAIGYELVDIDEIIGFSSSFSRGATIREIQQTGGDTTFVLLKNGRDLTSAWSLQEFTEQYDAHYDKLEALTDEKIKEEAEKRAEMYRVILEERLKEVKEKYAEHGINLDSTDI